MGNDQVCTSCCRKEESFITNNDSTQDAVPNGTNYIKQIGEMYSSMEKKLQIENRSQIVDLEVITIFNSTIDSFETW